METILVISIPVMFVFGLLVGSYGQKIKTDFYKRKVVILKEYLKNKDGLQKELFGLIRQLIEDREIISGQVENSKQ
ncbi:hypothetical protein P3G55_16640 [Leptospira sp. 96542]|nr:hypothetical protein [Leptospira sp. 96542]